MTNQAQINIKGK